MTKIIKKLRSLYCKFKLHSILRNRVRLSGKLNINGYCLLLIKKDTRLELGYNVTLNSNNRSYHLNIFAPVKLYSDRPGAVIKIGDNTRINGSCIHAYKSITIGKNCLIAANCQIIDGDGHDVSFPDVENRINTTGTARAIVIEDDVWVGVHSIILPGVRIGRGSVVAAGSIVTKDIPAMCLAGGNPARIIKDFGATE